MSPRRHWFTWNDSSHRQATGYPVTREDALERAERGLEKMTQGTLFQNLYIVYFKQQARIGKYNTCSEDETFRFTVKHQRHAHSFKSPTSTAAPAGSGEDEDPPPCAVTARPRLTTWSWSAPPCESRRPCSQAGHVSIGLTS